MPPDGTANIAQKPEDLRSKVKAQIVEAKPAFFKLEAQLPQQGRTDTPPSLLGQDVGRAERPMRRTARTACTPTPTRTTLSSSCRAKATF